jgi:F0F1-type ATP synthase epsilon subunit
MLPLDFTSKYVCINVVDHTGSTHVTEGSATMLADQRQPAANISEDRNRARRERDRARRNSLTTEQKEEINARRRAARPSKAQDINARRRAA